MSDSRIPKLGSKTDRIPAHYLDPIQKNPAPAGHPAHEIWEAATLQAEMELFQYQAEILAIRTKTGPEFARCQILLAFRTVQIWFKRHLCIVRNVKDVRAFEKWSESYVQAWLRDAPRYFAQRLSDPFLVDAALVELRTQLMRAQRHWTANAIQQVLANEGKQVEPSELTVATTASATPVSETEPAATLQPAAVAGSAEESNPTMPSGRVLPASAEDLPQPTPAASIADETLIKQQDPPAAENAAGAVSPESAAPPPSQTISPETAITGERPQLAGDRLPAATGDLLRPSPATPIANGQSSKRPIDLEPRARTTPAAASWDKVEMIVLNREDVEIRVDGSSPEILKYSSLGFADQRNGRPAKAWDALILLAREKGRIPEGECAGKVLYKRIQEIEDRLGDHFGIGDDPISFVPGTGYVSKFKIRLARSFDRD
jgi:hypothetical protein